LPEEEEIIDSYKNNAWQNINCVVL
jgi:hypothetical protein